ncbi:UNVERIFIED_CONTAM: hypothetical protein HDU68_010867 [Siphonaria sp. JEL0065]|nr:hypothetical protein HDU68_010867 [Siphonaria sp. JEL0065]
MAELAPMDGDPLTKEKVATFRVAKVFKHDKPFTCLDFDTSGTLCLATCEDELRMYDCLSGTHKKTSFSKKYGCAIAKFTHRPNNILYSSTKEDDAIRYLSFHDNKFLRYFTGHESKVIAIEMCPQDDQFLSASRDGEVRLWDLKSNNCHGILKTNSQNPRIAFDPTGLIFAVTTNSSAIRLYDLKSLASGPFATFKVPTDLGGSSSMSSEWTTIKFSNDGKWLLLGNKQGSSCAVESFDGRVLWNFADRNCGGYSGPLDMDIVVSPDGKFVLGGCDDGAVQFWEPPSVDDISTTNKQRSIFPCVKLTSVSAPSPLIKFNPRFMMFASASENNLERAEAIDYNVIEKKGSIIWTKVALEQAAELFREADNRNPAVFGLKPTQPDFSSSGELEVLENQLRVVLKHFKLANKKKSPQSAWKPVYASLEAITIYLQTKNSWVMSVKDAARVEAVFTAFGCAWVATAAHLTELGVFNENSYPSVRNAVNTTMAIGNEFNERVGRVLSDWPAKLESVWTGTEYAGDKKKKKAANNGGSDEAPKKKKKAKDGFESDDDETEKKKKKKPAKTTAVSDESPADPWDFEAAIARLKADRKQIGGNQFDIAAMSDELREKLAIAAI